MKKNILVLVGVLLSCYCLAQSRVQIDLSGGGWRLWKDTDNGWVKDSLYFPPVDLHQLPIHTPTGGWKQLNNENGISVAVPGTVEQYLQKGTAPQADLKGISWWWRSITIPKVVAGQKALLRFESVRCRAEVFINEQLVGYDLIGNTPFEVDISSFAPAGNTVRLAVRITDPGGNFDWVDGDMLWGKTNVSGSHGFGGITGRLQLLVCQPVYIQDIYLQNQPIPTKAIATIELNNQTNSKTSRKLLLTIAKKEAPDKVVFSRTLPAVSLQKGINSVDVAIDVPNAALWDVEHPNLYVCKVTIAQQNRVSDVDTQIFGFRWFEASGIGSNAVFRLNGKRVFVKTAISWGFWPVNGIFPTPELAEKQIKTAKELGLNMLNFHRCIGNPIVMEKADSMGLMYYEEPGNYQSGVKHLEARKWNHEKLLRMVKRDRSHPCMVIYNMQNEMRDVDSLTYISQQQDMAHAHRIDPSRIITRTSGWAIGKDIKDQAKLHARPFDTTLYMTGWYDYHRAGGPHTWFQGLYQSPSLYYGYSDNAKEIVYNGEEGALSTPPRIEKIQEAVAATSVMGWDGYNYQTDYQQFKGFYEAKKLAATFPSLDDFTKALGKISLYHQGRKIENNRICDVNDGYAVNGWESEPLENHSGIVDCYRNPKADAAVMAYYTQPVYVAIKPRKQVLATKDTVVTDIYLINEENIHGNGQLEVQLVAPTGEKLPTLSIPVHIKGGDVFGQLLAEALPLPLVADAGMYKIIAELNMVNGSPKPITGKDEVLAVDWRSSTISGKGAIWEYGDKLRQFLVKEKNLLAIPFDSKSQNLDWLLVARSPNGGDIGIVPQENLVGKDGTPGLDTRYFMGANFDTEVAQQKEAYIDMIVNQGATPHPKVPATFNYSVRWEGKLLPPLTGDYQFQLEVGYGGTGNLVINGQPFKLNPAMKKIVGSIHLEKGAAVPLLVELKHNRHVGACRFFWSIPDTTNYSSQILDKVEKEGTNLVLIDNADKWMPLLAEKKAIQYQDKFAVGTTWLGGVEFVKTHPLFKDLPTNQGMDWPYEMVVRKGNERLGFVMQGEELVAGAYHSYPQQLGTSVGIIPYGKGKIIFSTLDIYNSLNLPESTAEVSRKLLCNYLQFASKR